MAATDTRDVGRALGEAGLLGFGGPVLALVLSRAIIEGVRAALIPPLAAIFLILVAGQYVAFGGLALGYLRLRAMDWAAIRSYLGIRLPSIRDLLTVLGGWLLIIGSLVVISFVVQTLGAQPAENQAGELARELPAIIPFLIVAMFLVVGPSEEILYRGVVQGRLRESLGPAASIVLASAIFAVVHWFALTGGASARLTTVAILFVPSLVFGAVYEYTGNLVVPALLHAIHNSVLLALLWVSLQGAIVP